MVPARRRGWSVRRLAALAALAAAAALVGAARVTAPARTSTDVVFPRVQPARLAHLLADFSAHPALDRGAWSVQEEASNYTSWRYTVAYECGARCAGRVSVAADDRPAGHSAGPPRHGPAHSHHIVLRDVYCTRLPLLVWPQFCGETEIIAEVSGAGEGGARLSEQASARCGSVLSALALCGRCGDGRALRRLRDDHVRRLRLALE